jgi:hypothetical protein
LLRGCTTPPPIESQLLKMLPTSAAFDVAPVLNSTFSSRLISAAGRAGTVEIGDHRRPADTTENIVSISIAAQ